MSVLNNKLKLRTILTISMIIIPLLLLSTDNICKAEDLAPTTTQELEDDRVRDAKMLPQPFERKFMTPNDAAGGKFSEFYKRITPEQKLNKVVGVKSISFNYKWLAIALFSLGIIAIAVAPDFRNGRNKIKNEDASGTF